MRIVVVGTSGSGKTTMARRIGTALDLPVIELDAINWQPGWRALSIDDPAEFAKRAEIATRGDAWIVEGGYSKLAPLLWNRATHLVWLDYRRPTIMARVIRRSFARAAGGRELWPGTGNRENWRMWLTPEHPIRWAWSTFKRRRLEIGSRLREASYAHLVVLRLRHLRDAETVVSRLKSDGQRPRRGSSSAAPGGGPAASAEW